MSTEIMILLNQIDFRGYAEVFPGSAAVFFKKKPSPFEVLNDKNGNVANFYKAMQLRFDELHDMIKSTLHDEYTHSTAADIYRNFNIHSELDRAWAFWVLCNSSYSASLSAGFQYVKNKTDNWSPATRVKNKRDLFKHYRKRLESVTILNRDAIDIIKIYDGSDIVFYCDPPYVGANQGHYSGYSQSDFCDLLEALSVTKSKFILSSYPNDILSEYISEFNWTSEIHNKRLGVMGNSKRKNEVLTYNFTRKNHTQLQWL